MSTGSTKNATSPLPLIITPGDLPPATTPPSRTPPSSNESSSPQPSNSTGVAVGIAVGAVVILVVLSFLCICCRNKKRRRDEERRAREQSQRRRSQSSKPPSPAPIPSGQTSDVASPKPSHASIPSGPRSCVAPPKQPDAPIPSGPPSRVASPTPPDASIPSGSHSRVAPPKQPDAPIPSGPPSLVASPTPSHASIPSGPRSCVAPPKQPDAPIPSGPPSRVASPTPPDASIPSGSHSRVAPPKPPHASIPSGPRSHVAPPKQPNASIQSGPRSCVAPPKQHDAPIPSGPPSRVASPTLPDASIPSGSHSRVAPPKPPHAPIPSGQPSHAALPTPSVPPFVSSCGGSGSKHSGRKLLPPPSLPSGLRFGKNKMKYKDLADLTDNFSEANFLGKGGFGDVHKGIYPNGYKIAVKQLKAGSVQGESEFQAEVDIISRVHHKHLVSLVGYCSTDSRRLLAYEFVPNNTLEFHLHEKGLPTMDWSKRMRIALGSGKGLAYLHEDCHDKIIHRDIKSANILLDFNFEAKVADFGLAKITSNLDTHVSTRVMGTFGYLAPEYALSGKLTDKSDVFSYGVMLLELLTGRRPIVKDQTYMNDSLVEWARPLLWRAVEENNVDSLVDPRLQNFFDSNEMTRMVACAAACTRHSAIHRPKMSLVVRALEGDVLLADLNAGVTPGHSSVFSTEQYKEDMEIFKKLVALGAASECGLDPPGSSSENKSRQTARDSVEVPEA